MDKEAGRSARRRGERRTRPGRSTVWLGNAEGFQMHDIPALDVLDVRLFD
ncbi:MAG: hypothetical protein AVDCRST_MAG25-3352 [uncultured Rubrobacteraceae bacterium]|uniref:Uncharacterized protein n=1 Tax=uncultured Rubrobacteraceae bacterium TaxID=349277 RepID=A0A6J4SB37_9ACTN|nr:MAG: hypothetical protein AVDCRST_MAG25-3352 [uncultured Rubrobacteraceae bacterium]